MLRRCVEELNAVPNYEYKCTQCDHIFELWQNVGEAAPQCQECNSDVQKVFHPPRVIFKGSGFYLTDLRAEKGIGKSESSEGKSEAPKSEGASSSGSTSESSKAPAKDAGSSAPASTPSTNS
jgi:putative FmdB family regulatory protein